MSDRLAVAVVLLPPLEVMEEIVSLIASRPASPTKLNTHDVLPHLTVAMGVLEKSKIEEAGELLQQLVTKHGLPAVSISKSKNYQTPDNKQFSDLRAGPSPELERFHVATMHAFKGLLTYDDVSPTMFVSQPSVAETSTYWVQHYGDKRGREDFLPHITLGEGVIEPLIKNIEFTPDRLALCHLGTYCTCRQILAEAR